MTSAFAHLGTIRTAEAGPRAPREFSALGRAVALDPLSADDVMDSAHGVAPDLKRRLGLFEAEAGDPVAKILLAEADRAEAAVATAAAPADPVGLQYMRAHAIVARQVVGAGQAGIAAADDSDIGVEIAGHGIGLNLARELARLHGGELNLVSSDDEWTEFEVRFRPTEQAAANSHRPA